MNKNPNDKNVVKIRLDDKKPPASSQSTVMERLPSASPLQVAPVSAQPAAGVSMNQLKNNYQSILRAGAIYYPVVYQFVEELGRGRQGVVYLCHRQGARGCVTKHAIKVYDPGIYRSPEEYWTDMGRLASQITRLQALQSPNLVPMHSYEETYGIGYSQMEAIDGLDIRRLLSGDHLETAKRNSSPEEWARFTKQLFHIENNNIALQPGVVVYILRRMVRGLERLHSVNFLHSDIKPANIMTDRLGTIRIVDFGRAVLIGEKVTFLFGTPMYMAPEMHKREPGLSQSDFFSIGLVALEMLTGNPLMDANADEDALLKIKMELPDRLGDLIPPHVQKEKALIRIIRRLLEPEPAKRYGSAKEADVGSEGLIVVDTQFAKEGVTADSGRILSDYLSKLVDLHTGRIEIQEGKTQASSMRSEIIT